MMNKIVLIALAVALPLLAARGEDEIAAARAKYLDSKSPSSEAARTAYVHELIRMHDKIMKIGKGPQWTDAVDARFRAINDEIRKYPVPADSDSKALSKLRAGKWRSPRHDYLFRANGTWTMLPIEENATRGIWSIKGNQYSEHDDYEYIILFLDPNDFVFMDKEGTVFYEKRISK